MSHWNSKKKEETKDALLDALWDVFPEDKASAILDAIEAYVAIRIADATGDLEDKIKDHVLPYL